MSDKLVVYYSRKGSTRTVAEKLAEYLDCDIGAIESVRKFRGPLGFLAGGRASVKEFSVDIIEPEQNPEDYEAVIVCGPVWASNMAPPVRTYLTKNRDKFRKVAYLLTMGGTGQEKALESMGKAGGKPYKSVCFSRFERKSDVWTEKLTAFANEL